MDDEREARLQYERDRWSAWTATLDRIKQDEQRWVTVAIAVYGAIVVLLGAQGDRLFPRWTGPPGAVPHESQHLVGLLLSLALVHLFAWTWVRHALTLRVQYYRSMAELFRVQIGLGEPIPREWRDSCPERWRREATRPGESKLGEMLLVLVLTAAVTALSAFLAVAAICTLDIRHPWLSYGGTVGCTVVSLVVAAAWPWFIYPRWDGARMGALHAGIADLWGGVEGRESSAEEPGNSEGGDRPRGAGQ